jgi:predicted dinucleotide-binding enzyme
MFMKVANVGTRKLGAARAKRLGLASHQVMSNFDKNARDLEATARGYGTRTDRPGEAASFCAFVVLAIKFIRLTCALAAFLAIEFGESCL